MSKPSIQNIVVTQTFQNWFDKTNEMVDIMRDSAVTASVSGDTTTGDATLVGDFTANTVIAWNTLAADLITAKTSGATIQFNHPIQITGPADPITAIFSHPNNGCRTRYTSSAVNWDIGIDNATSGKFTMYNTGGTGVLSLSTQGVLEVVSIITSDDVVVGGDLTVSGMIYGDITANNINVSTGLTGVLTGDLIGDVYAPNGTTKVLENGNGTTIPATFTGNVNGTVSSLSNQTTNNLAEGAGATPNLYFTKARAIASFKNGTGVTIGTADANGVAPISIGQAVGTGANVQFASVVATGNITAFFGTTSDIRVKENIEPITGALDKVSKIGGYTFNHKGSDERMAGVVAQELLEVLPEAVFETKDPRTGEDIYAVRYDNIIGLLIEAIKELKEQVGK
jgi:hypothetical protein